MVRHTPAFTAKVSLIILGHYALKDQSEACTVDKYLLKINNRDTGITIESR